jgi:hypothetical protein
MAEIHENVFVMIAAAFANSSDGGLSPFSYHYKVRKLEHFEVFVTE